MRSAVDTPDERLQEYGALFELALLRRERRPDAVVFHFRFEAAIRERLFELARRESACCPFLDYRVETAGDELVWTTTDPLQGEERAGVEAFLDALHELPGHADSDIAGLFERMAAQGVEVRS